MKWFFRHEVHIGTSEFRCTNHAFAYVEWLSSHDKHDKYLPFTIVSCTTVDTENCSNFIPVARIAACCAIIRKMRIVFDYGEDCVTVAVPLAEGLHL